MTRKAFGLPTFGVTQPGHAAMTTWTAGGWEVELGAGWEYSWWDHALPERGGMSFYTETLARELRPQYQQILRGDWAARARNETGVNLQWTPREPSSYGQGGTWSALMLYAKKIANATHPPTPRPIGPAVVPTKIGAFLKKWQEPLPTPNITVDATKITVPAAAIASKAHNAPVATMWSFDAGEQLVHSAGNFAHPEDTAFSYVIEMEEAGTKYLTANISTWHMNTNLILSTNTTEGKQPINVPVYWTVGYWNQTQPVEVDLVKGTNVLTFTRSSPAAIVIKDFFLYTTKPDVPPPNKNHTTKPIPPPSAYIEVSPMTTCQKQGISMVPKNLC